jgi:formylglycine-generating enzyme required for sulfatase activity
VNGGFALAKYETTFEQWMNVLRWAVEEGYTFNETYCEGTYNSICGGFPEPQTNQPVIGMSWYDAIVWLNALSVMNNLQPVYMNANGQTLTNSVIANGETQIIVNIANGNNGFRLPTSNEWELAAKWIDGVNWNPGNRVSGASDDVFNVEESIRYGWLVESSEGYTQGVGQLLPNQAGLYDMSGNAWEWTQDTNNNGEAVVRGGHYNNSLDPFGYTGFEGLHPQSLGSYYFVNGIRIAKNI